MNSKKFFLNPNESDDLDRIGTKAFNLLGYTDFTPNYFVVSSELYQNWQIDEVLVSRSLSSQLTSLVAQIQRRGARAVIVRSSCTDETIKDRGKFLSLKCDANVDSIKDTIISIYEDFVAKTEQSGSVLALIIQDYKPPKLQGHLSNERRVGKEKDTWKIEKENVSSENIEVATIKAENKKTELDLSLRSCLNAHTLTKHLELTASIFTQLKDRFHLEWLWDGVNFWLLQIDIEKAQGDNSKPGSEWFKSLKSKKLRLGKGNDGWTPEVFESLGTSSTEWHKIECLRTFSKCDLDFWDIFILENEFIIEKLISGEIDIQLSSDLRRLIQSPITIRTDKKSEQEVLLPRSDTIFNFDEAVEFLIKTSKELASKGLKSGQFCFLIHHFVISRAGALAFSKPNIDKVRIDSTWGIVEGLYYHPHDSFELDVRKNKLHKKIRCKYKYIDVNEKGGWYSKKSGEVIDWRQSLTKRQIEKIAEQTRRIVEFLNKPATVMFFVNDSRSSLPEVLPWYYSIDEIPEKKTNSTEIFFSDKSELIETKSDFDGFKSFVEGKQQESKKFKIRLNLGTEIIRDIQLIEDISSFCVDHNIVVDIEGSILSHPYYVLSSNGVQVNCIDPLELNYNQREFYKLVRDEIPVIIQSNDESVRAVNVSPEILIQMLREKVVEEALEMYWSERNDELIEEAADVLEVLLGICRSFGIEFSEIMDIAKKKKERRGGFDKGVFLIASKENSLFEVVKDGSKNKLFSHSDSHQIDAKQSRIIKFFKSDGIENFKSLTEVSSFKLPYVNNYASKSHSFRYLLKDDDYKTVLVEYGEKDISIKFENENDWKNDSDQLNVFDS